MTYKDAKKDPRWLNINTNGNRKLKNNETTRFIIWNLPAEKTCPFATEHCKKACYAKKAERLYPAVSDSRWTNYQRTLSNTFVSEMVFTLKQELAMKKYAGKKVVVRIHESGDFYSVEYARKWVLIAKEFEKYENITFIAYTKSLPFIMGCGYRSNDFPKNFVVRFSVWDDTRATHLLNIKAFGLPIYTALSTQDMERERMFGREFTECRCDDCASCGKCWNKNIKDIIVKIH